MAKDREWIDCICCGALGSMVFKNDVSQTFGSPKFGIEPYEITGLAGHFCTECGDGFFTQKSERKIDAIMGYHHAIRNAKITLFCDLVEPEYMAKALGITRQAVHAMMKAGRIKYALLDTGLKLPLKSELERLQKEKEDKRKIIPVNWEEHKTKIKIR